MAPCCAAAAAGTAECLPSRPELAGAPCRPVRAVTCCWEDPVRSTLAHRHPCQSTVKARTTASPNDKSARSRLPPCARQLRRMSRATKADRTQFSAEVVCACLGICKLSGNAAEYAVCCLMPLSGSHPLSYASWWLPCSRLSSIGPISYAVPWKVCTGAAGAALAALCRCLPGSPSG